MYILYIHTLIIVQKSTLRFIELIFVIPNTKIFINKDIITQ